MMQYEMTPFTWKAKTTDKTYTQPNDHNALNGEKCLVINLVNQGGRSLYHLHTASTVPPAKKFMKSKSKLNHA